MTITGDTDVYYDPFDVAINADPYPTFRRLRDEAQAPGLIRRADAEAAVLDYVAEIERTSSPPR